MAPLQKFLLIVAGIALTIFFVSISLAIVLAFIAVVGSVVLYRRFIKPLFNRQTVEPTPEQEAKRGAMEVDYVVIEEDIEKR